MGILNNSTAAYIVSPSSLVTFSSSAQTEGQGNLSVSVVVRLTSGQEVCVGVPTLPSGISVSSGIVFSGQMMP